MANRKLINTVKASADQIYHLISRDILIYPVIKNGRWYIQVDNYGNIKTFDKPILEKDINEAIAKTIIFYYKKLTD
jgi:hypothetical protein